MKQSELIKKQNKVIEEQNEKIKKMESTIDVLSKKVANTSRTKLSEEIEQAKSMVKKTKKFDVKMWLLTSSFAICSCIFGLVNLILNLTKNK